MNLEPWLVHIGRSRPWQELGFDSRLDGKPLDGSELGCGQLTARDYCVVPVEL